MAFDPWGGDFVSGSSVPGDIGVGYGGTGPGGWSADDYGGGDEGLASDALYPGSAPQPIKEWINPEATPWDWITGFAETVLTPIGDFQFGKRDVFGIPGQTSRDFTRAAAGLYGPQEQGVEVSPLGGILGTLGARLAPEEGQSRMYGYAPWEQGEQTDFTFKDLLPGSWFEDKPAVRVSQAIQQLRDSETVGGPFIDGVEARPRLKASPQSRAFPGPVTYRVDPRGGGILEDRDGLDRDELDRARWGYDPSGRPWLKRPGSFDQGGPVVKQYEDGGPAVADQQIPKIPMEATGIVAGLLDVQRKGSTEDIVGFVQTHRGDLEYLAKIDDPRFDIVRSTLIQFGAPAVPAPPQIKPRRSLLPSERILRDILSAQEEQRMSEQDLRDTANRAILSAQGEQRMSEQDLFSLQEHVPAMSSEEIMQQTKPGFSGVADQGFTLGERIKGDVFPPQMQRGGHVGRGTMAGELAPRGSLPVREAGESMYERFKRLHGDRQDYQGGGPVHHGPSSGVRRLKESVLSPSMQRRIFG